MLATNPNKSSCVSVARDILNDIDKDKWLQKLMSEGNALNGNELRTYRKYRSEDRILCETNYEQGPQTCTCQIS